MDREDFLLGVSSIHFLQTLPSGHGGYQASTFNHRPSVYIRVDAIYSPSTGTKNQAVENGMPDLTSFRLKRAQKA